MVKNCKKTCGECRKHIKGAKPTTNKHTTTTTTTTTTTITTTTTTTTTIPTPKGR